MDYCAPKDVYDYGVPRGSVPNPARLLASQGAADPTADVLTLDEHGFDTGDVVRFRAEGNGTLPAPLVANTPYYVIALDDSRFQVAASSGGAAIDLTTAGARTLVIAKSPILAAITWASRLFDDMCPAHAVPLEEPIPPIVRMTTAELAASKFAGRAGCTSKALSEIVNQARKRVERWASGVPIRGTDAPATHTNTAAVATASDSSVCTDPSGWNRFGGL